MPKCDPKLLLLATGEILIARLELISSEGPVSIPGPGPKWPCLVPPPGASERLTTGGSGARRALVSVLWAGVPLAA